MSLRFIDTKGHAHAEGTAGIVMAFWEKIHIHSNGAGLNPIRGIKEFISHLNTPSPKKVIIKEGDKAYSKGYLVSEYAKNIHAHSLFKLLQLRTQQVRRFAHKRMIHSSSLSIRT